MRVHLGSQEESEEARATLNPSVRTLDRPRADEAGLQIHEYAGFDALPASYDELLETAGKSNVRWSRPWLVAALNHGASLTTPPLLLGVEDAVGRAAALNVGFSLEYYGESAHCRALALQIDEEPYRPIVSGAVSALDVLQMVAHYAHRSDPPYDALRISPLDPELFERLPPILRAEGWIRQRFFMFANRYEDVSGCDSNAYLQARPPRLRSTIERRTRSLEKSDRSRIEIIETDVGLDTTTWDFERVFSRSWKQGLTEVPYQRALMKVAAQAGALRLALLYIDDAPAAAQFWLMSGGVGYLHRLAYDERFRDLSPGTVLTWHVIRHLLDVDRVDTLDFGIGDDAYKRDWVSGLRERWGIVGFNPRTLRGLRGAVWNIGGHAVRNIARVVLRPLIDRPAQAGIRINPRS